MQYLLQQELNHYLTISFFFSRIKIEKDVIFLKSIGAGILIGLGALANLFIGGPLGALLFATGLLTICIN